VRTRRTAVGRVVVALVAVAVVVAAIYAAFALTSTTCPTISAGPGRLSLRVVFDSNQTSVSGAQVTATSIPEFAANCYGGQATLKFTTSNAEWYPLNATDWPSGFSLVVRYSGQSYSFTVSLPVEALTCASLYIPSGTTNTTNAGFQNICPSAPTTTTSSTSPTPSGMSNLYQLEFVQESNCPYGSWVYPWGVMLNGETLTQPSNATLPLSYSNAHLTSNSSYSTISFSVPNGVYSYAVVPTGFAGKQSGNVTVSGSNVEVEVWSFITAMGCSTSASG
jgi:hypothetical protein